VDIPSAIAYNRRVESTRSRLTLIVVAVVALLLAGLVAFQAAADADVEVRLGDAAAQALDAAPEAPAADADRELARIVVESNGASNLPVPEAVPDDPYAPTPEIRHGSLDIPAIGLSQPLFEGVTLTAIDRGPSHWPGTAMPGELGNVVVAGHRTTHTRPFWDLHLLEPGDELVFTTDAGRFVYVLDSIEIVNPEDIHIVTQHHAHTATLFACHPRGSARQRIVGHFTLAD
jgi:sortase A